VRRAETTFFEDLNLLDICKKDNRRAEGPTACKSVSGELKLEVRPKEARPTGIFDCIRGWDGRV
jgi:hypothetical protein